MSAILPSTESALDKKPTPIDLQIILNKLFKNVNKTSKYIINVVLKVLFILTVYYANST